MARERIHLYYADARAIHLCLYQSLCSSKVSHKTSGKTLVIECLADNGLNHISFLKPKEALCLRSCMGLVCIVSVPKRRCYFVKFLELCRRQQRVQESTCITKVSWNVALWSWQRDTINLFVHYPSFSVLGRMEHWNIYLSVSLHTTCCLLHLSL